MHLLQARADDGHLGHRTAITSAAPKTRALPPTPPRKFACVKGRAFAPHPPPFQGSPRLAQARPNRSSKALLPASPRVVFH